MLRIERRNVEGLGSKEMAFDKLMTWPVVCMFIVIVCKGLCRPMENIPHNYEHTLTGQIKSLSKAIF